MALIKCVGCGREISDKAAACPQCGRAAVGRNTQKAASHDPSPVSGDNGSRKKPHWIAWFCVIAFILLVITCAIRNSETHNAGWEQTRSASPQTMTREQIIGEKTIAYWRSIASVLVSLQQSDKQTPQAVIATVRRAAGQIRVLPTVNVDPDAVQCGNDVATVLNNFADYHGGGDDPAVLVGAALRGMNLGFFGALQEVLDTQSAMRQQSSQVQNELDNARAILSARYGVEFPRL